MVWRPNERLGRSMPAETPSALLREIPVLLPVGHASDRELYTTARADFIAQRGCL
jgi:hypothetical protein